MVEECAWPADPPRWWVWKSHGALLHQILYNPTPIFYDGLSEAATTVYPILYTHTIVIQYHKKLKNNLADKPN
jgi:hypothetical protein